MGSDNQKLVYLGAEHGFQRVAKRGSSRPVQPQGRLTQDDVSHAQAQGYFYSSEFMARWQRQTVHDLHSRLDGAVHFDGDLTEVEKVAHTVFKMVTGIKNDARVSNAMTDAYLPLARELAMIEDREWQQTPESDKDRSAAFNMAHAVGLTVLFMDQHKTQHLDGAKNLLDFLHERDRKQLPRIGVTQQFGLGRYANPSYMAGSHDQRRPPLSFVGYSDMPQVLEILWEQKSSLFKGALDNAENIIYWSLPENRREEEGARHQFDYERHGFIGGVYTFLQGIKSHEFEHEAVNKTYDRLKDLRERGFESIRSQQEALAEESRRRRMMWQGPKQ